MIAIRINFIELYRSKYYLKTVRVSTSRKI